MIGIAKSKPRITVTLPVYNGEKYVAAAIRSVLAQTFEDFELVVIDDGSTDHTREILTGFSDARLRLICHCRNLGLVTALNTAIRESQGEFIARMDADDICHARRLERQLAFLEAHPEVSICGTWFRTFGARKGSVRLPIDPEHIRARTFFGWAMGHPTIMMRRAFLEQHALTFNEEFRNCEDLEFLARAAQFTRLATLPEFLLLYRIHDAQVTMVHKEDMSNNTNRVRLRQLRMLMPSVTSEEEALHVDLLDGVLCPSKLPQAERWLLRLDRANVEKGRYDARYFRRELQQRWYYAHTTQAALAGIPVLWSYWQSPLASMSGIGLYNHAAMAAKSVIRRPAPAWWKIRRQFLE